MSKNFLICLNLIHSIEFFQKILKDFFSNLVYPFYSWVSEKENAIELVKGFDKSKVRNYYIA